MSRIDLYLDSLEHAYKRVGTTVPWPVHLASVAPYFSDVEASDLYAKIRMLSVQPGAYETIGKLLVGPSVTKGTLMDLLIGLKVVRPALSVDERVWFAEFVFSTLQIMQAGDIFCRGGTNQILSAAQAQVLCGQCEGSWSASRDFARLVYRASVSAQTLIWTLYFYGWTDVGYEIHGPYEVIFRGKRVLLLVRDFFDLRPTPLWGSMRSFPYQSIRIVALYAREAGLEVDIFNHLTHKTNLLDCTVAVCMEVDGRPATSESEVGAVLQCVSRRVSEQNALVQAMSREEVIKKFIESRYYVFRRMRAHFAEDWHPPAKVLQRIEDWGPLEVSHSSAPGWESLRRAFDPRTEFVPNRDVIQTSDSWH